MMNNESYYKEAMDKDKSMGRTSPVDMKKQIFCNRTLNMKSIIAVGFDMDYTLAQYKSETFETMAYHGTVKKLVYDLGYPKELLQWNFDWNYMVRGLVLDKRRGNFLKMDRHKYVKLAYHGFSELPRQERSATYGNSPFQQAYDEPDYALIDTLFSLAEAYLFAQLVEFIDEYPEKIPPAARAKSDGELSIPFNFSQVYKDIRAAVDLCHRDGTLKQAVAEQPSKYIHFDPLLLPMLKMLRESGRLTFIVTNSLWDYTNVVMSYLCRNSELDKINSSNFDWLNYFDLVITGSAKPGFFAEEKRCGFFEVDISSGMLMNTDNGTPLPQVGDVDFRRFSASKNGIKQPCRVFQGGKVQHLHRLLGIESGSQVLYIGDHIYGDILRSKKKPGWRTMLVIPELEQELELFHQTIPTRKELRLLREKRDIIEDQIEQLNFDIRSSKYSDDNHKAALSKKEGLEAERDRIRDLHRDILRKCHVKFHETWGQLMQTGYQSSRFANQVERFACLYTSQVTNLCYYSTEKSFRTTEDFMPHELKSLEI
ncbi:hypothetical protein KP509_29G077200 [Ceratopteris richardii]|uniref:Uncharacterized protein n=1 Tax=Ceratopteris richardii TaxID=49495 RepID=A0A8T2RAT6_CERRI|nr:hypothetical protein KP509_29G077200 [Ceratopteris richardii]KAH7292603.1 hypothetical protein KP509_29G077200 [Ceratopteris richardii]KAH7292604.1 hypothetical protein KP509_29G077200 [Ceratopteris richardii]KAH7292605.1 hypothetical protein KP509_29G077200 [Ceratopteris richardii]KAH7292606.1 hypothetical protein KP509_29G077200 [Ceratopteris richardii]